MLGDSASESKMVKRVRSDLGPFSLQNHNHLCVKFAASFFLVGLAVRLLLWDSFSSFASLVETQSQSQSETPSPYTEPNAESPVKAESPVFSFPLEAHETVEFQGNNQSQNSLNGKLTFSVVLW